MMKRLIISVITSCVCAFAVFAGAAAENLPIAAFFGTYSGGGVAQNRDSLFFGVTARDFDVTIAPVAGNGFRIDWTSVIRSGGSPDRPDIRRNATSRTLSPTGVPGSFRCKETGDPLRGGELCWARIRAHTLSMFSMTVGADGSYELQQYDRTLSGAGMKLKFTSHRDGETVRTVTGHLVMTAK